MHRLPWLCVAVSLAALSGCAEYGSSGMEGRAQTTDSFGPPSAGGQLRIDVFPGELVDASGAIRALPQTSDPIDTNEEGLVDVGILPLKVPGSLSGLVTGDLVTPLAVSSGLPVTPGVVPATVRITKPGTVQNYTATTLDGVYEAVVVPSDVPYRVSVVPDDPAIPFGSREIAFRDLDEVQDFDLGYGVPLYGRVTTGNDEPVQNARVHVADGNGIVSSITRTDAGGWYTVRVLEDEPYHVVCAGRDSGRDPVVTSPFTVAEPEAGTRVDFHYPNLSGSFATGRVVDSEGLALPDVTVRFTATSLSGYEALDASLVLEDRTDANGNFEASLLDGTYDVAFLPPSEADPALDHGAVLLEGRETGAGGLIFGNQGLPDLTSFSGDVLDPSGNPMGQALLTCHEIDLGGRSWSTFTKDNGRFEFMVPPSPLRCVIQPPADRTDRFAWTTEVIDASIDDGHQFEIREGTLVLGQVRMAGIGEPYALVEVRDEAGTVLGSTITQGDSGTDAVGSFRVRVDITSE